MSVKENDSRMAELLALGINTYSNLLEILVSDIKYSAI